MRAVQKQLRNEMAAMGSVTGDPLGQLQFHIPLFAGAWSVVREGFIVSGQFSRGYKGVLAAAISRGNLCRFCCFWHANCSVRFAHASARQLHSL